MKKNSGNPSLEGLLHSIRVKDEKFWLKERERHALSVFHRAASEVPAYKDFLKRHRIRAEKIRTFRDFASVPPTSKKEYLRKYPLEKLMWQGTLRHSLVFTATSGSTGEPFYFPRTYQIDWQAGAIHELFFRQSQESIKGPTLVLVCFGMGIWIGGLITYQAFEIMREEGKPISIITPGINKIEIFKALKQIGPRYQQIIMVGYAPFLKDVVDEAPQHGVNFKNLNTRFIFAAEAFTEGFRDYLTTKTNLHSRYLDTMNIYGSADLGAMAFETPLAILVRRIAMRKHRLFAELFHQIHRTPTLAQYIPSFITFEEQRGELFLTSNNAIPLVRYEIGDHGGIFTYREIFEKCALHATDLLKEIKIAGLTEFIYKLPFVYVYERVDLSTTLYGLQIYPETVREVLIEKPMNEFLTGKATLLTKFDSRKDQYLEINLELKKSKKITPKVKKITLSQIVSNLRLKNSEFRELHSFIGKRSFPKLVFWPAEHPQYFKPGIKQKWVDKK